MPDAGVVRPGVPRRDEGGRVALGGSVEHRELGAVRHHGKRDPDKGCGVVRPCVDLERQRSAVRVGEPDVAAFGDEAVVVVEPGDAGFGDAHENGEVRERRGAGVAIDREDDAVGEAVGLDRLEVDRGPGGQRERGEREEGEDELLHGLAV